MLVIFLLVFETSVPENTLATVCLHIVPNEVIAAAYDKVRSFREGEIQTHSVNPNAFPSPNPHPAHLPC